MKLLTLGASQSNPASGIPWAGDGGERNDRALDMEGRTGQVLEEGHGGRRSLRPLRVKPVLRTWNRTQGCAGPLLPSPLAGVLSTCA